jgi:mono/diheme cytochrome c family protein
MRRASHVVIALTSLVPAAMVSGFPWDKDMVDQPSVKPQEAEAPAAPNTVPVDGTETLPAPTTEAGMFEAKDAAVSVRNPVPATPESVALGESLFQTYCLVCHGAEGRGDGPVGILLETSPVDLHDAYTQDQADGQLFFTITRGRVTMPYYREALSQEERWHVINYIRAAFGSE